MDPPPQPLPPSPRKAPPASTAAAGAVPVASNVRTDTNALPGGDASSIHTVVIEAPSMAQPPNDLSKTPPVNAALSIDSSAAASPTAETKLSLSSREGADFTSTAEAPPVNPAALQLPLVDAASSEQPKTAPFHTVREATTTDKSINPSGVVEGTETTTIDVAQEGAATVENATTDSTIVEGVSGEDASDEATPLKAASTEVASVGAATDDAKSTAEVSSAVTAASVIPNCASTTTPDDVNGAKKANDFEATSSAEKVPRTRVTLEETQALDTEAEATKGKSREEARESKALAPASEKEKHGSVNDVVESPSHLGNSTRRQSKRPHVESVADESESGEKTTRRATRRMKS